MTLLDELSAPFEPSKISWRVGSTTKDKTKGMALAYIDARDVMERLDEVVGGDKWQCRYSHADKKTICEISILIPGPIGPPGLNNSYWVTKANGAGDSDIEAEKGAISDAFKRAAVMWGIGRYLYDLKSPWVFIEAFGNSYKIKDSEKPILEKLLGSQIVDDKKEHQIADFLQAIADCDTMDMLNATAEDIKSAGISSNSLREAWIKRKGVIGE